MRTQGTIEARRGAAAAGSDGRCPRRQASWLAPLAFAWIGCEGAVPPERLAVHLAGVYDHSEQPRFTPGEAEAAALRALARVDGLELRSEASDDVIEARVIFGELPETDEAGQFLVYAVLDDADRRFPRLRGHACDASVLIDEDIHDSKALPGLFEGAVGRAAQVLVARTDLAAGEVERIAGLLDADDPELTALALEWLRDHPTPGHSERVLALLDHPDERVALLAIEALGSLGGREHVRPLLRRVELADPGRTHRAYDALGSLGGPEAIAFLEFAARNEDEAERQAAALRALERARGVQISSAELPSLEGHRR